ncbi:hypothetical protein [Paenibacillus polymyxa]|uniref:hypothetical protein n=1 Tax=Paenibacillus polymyxa TaxID=1406 RepID=UPI003217757F
MELVKISNGLLTEKYTTVHHEKDYQFNAPHYFEVHDHSGNVWGIFISKKDRSKKLE